jgi:hypothetical protein
VVDKMLSAVTERQGPLIRFNDAFLDFLRIFHITPIACNVASPHKKERSKISSNIYAKTSGPFELLAIFAMPSVQLDLR